MTTNLHAHIDTNSRDCDGQYDSSHVRTMSDENAAKEFSDFRFKETTFGSVVSWHAEDAEVHITPEGFSYSQPTEEGYTRTWVRWCEDECDEAQTTYRDHTAESMGY